MARFPVRHGGWVQRPQNVGVWATGGPSRGSLHHPPRMNLPGRRQQKFRQPPDAIDAPVASQDTTTIMVHLDRRRVVECDNS